MMRSIVISLAALALSGGVASADRSPHNNYSHGSRTTVVHTQSGNRGYVNRGNNRGSNRGYVNRGYNRGYVNRGYNRGYVNRGYNPGYNRTYVNRGYGARGYYNRGYYNRGYYNDGYYNRGYYNRGYGYRRPFVNYYGYPGLWIAGGWRWNGVAWIWYDGYYDYGAYSPYDNYEGGYVTPPYD
jgi:hypothetical protein